MKYIWAALFLQLLVVSSFAGEPEQNKVEVKEIKKHNHMLWGYDGETGPENWGFLSPEYSSCNGLNQSPINITHATEALLPPLKIHYTESPLFIKNTGHTIQVDMDSDSYILLDSEQYKLLQFHFHSPSENHINGKNYPLEVQLVHANYKNELAVIGVMFEESKTNEMIEGLWSFIEKFEDNKYKSNGILVNASALLPANKDYYRFNGSLTTPPCTEGVKWLVMKEPLPVSNKQVKTFFELFGVGTNRPVQPLNARVVLK